MLHSGLGKAGAIESVTVRWPAGATERFEGARVDGRSRWFEGSGRAVAVAPPPAAPLLEAQALPNTKVTAQSRSVLPTRLPFPTLSCSDPQGKSRALEFVGAKPQLVVVWTSWCCCCTDELDALVKARASLVPLQILALSLDEADDHLADRAAALALAKEKGFSWPIGFLDAAGVERVRGFYAAPCPRHPPKPAPTSFLLDPALEQAAAEALRTSE